MDSTTLIQFRCLLNKLDDKTIMKEVSEIVLRNIVIPDGNSFTPYPSISTCCYMCDYKVVIGSTERCCWKCKNKVCSEYSNLVNPYGNPHIWMCKNCGKCKGCGIDLHNIPKGMFPMWSIDPNIFDNTYCAKCQSSQNIEPVKMDE